MTPPNCSTTRGDLFQTVTMVYLSIILILGTVLNALALWVFCCRMRRWTETRVYMANLAGADCCLLLSLPMVLYTMGKEQSEGFLCTVSQSIYLINSYMSICITTAIAVDRFAAIRYPLRARVWRCPRQAAGTCALLWLLVICLVSLTAWKQNGQNFCFGKSKTRGFWAIVFSLALFFIPLMILVFCSMRVLQKLMRKKAHALAQDRRLIHKTVCVVSANLVIFLVCFLPQHAALLAKLITDYVGASCPVVQRVIISVRVASRLANANCCLDALGYYFVAQEFQEEVGVVLGLPKIFQNQTQGSPGAEQPSLLGGRNEEKALVSSKALCSY